LAGKVCGECKFYLVRGVCPRAEYKKRDLNVTACAPTDKACELFQPKYKKNSDSEFDMGEALTLVNEGNTFVCPTDSKELHGYSEGYYIPFESKVHKILEDRYGEALKSYNVEEVVKHLQRANYVERETINKFFNKTPIQNGLFNFRTHDVEPFSPEEIFTYKLNVSYDPEAKCPNFLKFLAEILPDENDRKLLQEIAGYCLLPAMPFHKLFWFYGIGRNGKDRIILTLENILGEENTSHLNLGELREGRRFSLCQLYGKLLNVSSEPDSKYPIQTNILKLISGENTIHAELKNRNNRLRFRNKAKIIVVGNSFPKVEDSSIGFWDRVTVLNFPRSFAEDESIQNIERGWLEKPDETPGLFNWMLEGLYRLQEKGVFSTSKTIEETKQEFMRVSDPFRAWLNDCCRFLPEAYLTRKEAYNNYKEYADELGATPDSERTFYGKMRQAPKIKDIKKRIKGTNKRIFQGITLKIETEEDESQTKLENGADGADGAGKRKFYSHGKNENHKNKEDNKIPAPSAPSAPKPFDVDETFTQLQCFDCRRVLTRDTPHTFYEGKPCCFSCFRKIEAQKRRQDRGDS
jgi:P4 family phage/plasmid primase-like protien